MMMYGVANGLSMNYYMMNCPFADQFIVKNTVDRALQSDPTLAAALGSDGSILIDSTKDNTAEKDSPANLSLRGYEIIDAAKDALGDSVPELFLVLIFWPWLLEMLFSLYGQFLSGGPVYDIPKGRKDGRRSKIEDTINLPPPKLNSSELIRMFGQRGFTPQQMVALSGAHTLGTTRCSSFKNRLTNFDSTHDMDGYTVC
ncbi:UNVERIFIED_CONTAM: Peroxidase 47 [Sesamum calycinum]|uniref:peroxidase n=1 Tax=Sesamum calycinum TaxID=2727403 RepID=A0AAW2JIM1_9LAMI